jgi:hypothetical protein
MFFTTHHFLSVAGSAAHSAAKIAIYVRFLAELDGGPRSLLELHMRRDLQ